MRIRFHSPCNVWCLIQSLLRSESSRTGCGFHSSLRLRNICKGFEISEGSRIASYNLKLAHGKCRCALQHLYSKLLIYWCYCLSPLPPREARCEGINHDVRGVLLHAWWLGRKIFALCIYVSIYISMDSGNSKMPCASSGTGILLNKLYLGTVLQQRFVLVLSD